MERHKLVALSFSSATWVPLRNWIQALNKALERLSGVVWPLRSPRPPLRPTHVWAPLNRPPWPPPLMSHPFHLRLATDINSFCAQLDCCCRGEHTHTPDLTFQYDPFYFYFYVLFQRRPTFGHSANTLPLAMATIDWAPNGLNVFRTRNFSNSCTRDR